ncbi:MAG: alpha/beta hydrolase family protein [Eubacteriales bacterium]|nr:alpha/beta hydrolase family protein [Eubacteriales bacterium]
MAYLHCEIFSRTLDMATAFVAILPEEGSLKECPVVYLLHGLSDNCTGWSRYTAVERIAREKGAAVIMPEVQRSFYTDMALGLPYFSYITQELPQLCSRMFGLSGKKEDSFIMGLSMGGYGALKCALSSPERYAGCASFSAVTDIAARVRGSQGMRRREFQAIFGPALEVPEGARLDALLRCQQGRALPRILMTCGEQDSLFAENLRFAAELQAAGAQPSFHSWPGDHNWAFWDRSVQLAFDFFLGKL